MFAFPTEKILLAYRYPVYTVGESGAMYTPSSGQYYSPGNTTPVTYTQVNQILMVLW